jgi:hypothetical protein
MPRPNRGASKTIAASGEPVVVLDAYRPVNTTVAYPIVITLGVTGPLVEPIVPADAALFVSLRAIVRWGIGGSAEFEAVVDWLEGTRLSVSAERVLVKAVYDVDVPRWLPSPKRISCPERRVSAGVGYGHASGEHRASLTSFVALEKLGDSEVVPFPPFAVGFTVMPANGGTATARIVFPSSALAVPVTVTTPTTASGTFPIKKPNGASGVAIENAGAGPAFALVVFTMAM